jgi:hypothetical protein
MRKELVPNAKEILTNLIKTKNKNLEVFLGNKVEVLNNLDPGKLAQMALDWGLLSHQGLCCGILGCNTEVEIRCAVCDGGYCKDHKEWHTHADNYNGIIEKDYEDV